MNELPLFPATQAHTKLVKKYAPQSLADLVVPAATDLSAVRRFLAKPYSDAFLFHGRSGVGKTSLARIMANAATQDTPLHIIHLVGADLDAHRCKRLQEEIASRPLLSPMWAVIVDEADAITPVAQIRLLHLLEELPDHAVMVFTSNEELQNFEPRFTSRVKCTHFSTQGLAVPAAAWLARIARQEGMQMSEKEAEKTVRLAKNNLREALNELDQALASQLMFYEV